MVSEEILMEIDTTLDRLIRNAEAIQGVALQDLSETEVDAFQKTQESLVHHLLYLDKRLEDKRKSLRLRDGRSAGFQIQSKLLKFEKLKTSCQKEVIEAMQRKRTMASKRRAKRLLAGRA